MEKVRRRNPGAFILWAYGMCDHTMAPVLEEIARRFPDPAFDTLLLPAAGPGDMGARQHPGRGIHIRAAEMIAERLRRALGETD